MKNWIMNFIADERGAESVEYGSTAVVAAGGAIGGLVTLKNKVQGKQAEMALQLDEADAG